MRNGRGFRPVVVRATPRCGDCDEPGEVQLAGGFYCPRCALETVVRTLRTEVGLFPLASLPEVSIPS